MIEELWIVGDLSDGPFLEGLGVDLGPYVVAEGKWVLCRMTEEAMERLDEHWGRFSWGTM